MHTAGKGLPTLAKKLDSSGSVPESETTREGVHLQAVVVMEAHRLVRCGPSGPARSPWPPGACELRGWQLYRIGMSYFSASALMAVNRLVKFASVSMFSSRWALSSM